MTGYRGIARVLTDAEMTTGCVGTVMGNGSAMKMKEEQVGIARLRTMAEGTGKGIIVGMVAAETVCWHFKNWECFSALAVRHAIL